MTLQMPLRLPLSEPQGLPLRKPLGLGIPYSLLPTPNSQIPSPTWLPDLYLTYQGTPRQAAISHSTQEDQ